MKPWRWTPPEEQVAPGALGAWLGRREARRIEHLFLAPAHGQRGSARCWQLASRLPAWLLAAAAVGLAAAAAGLGAPLAPAVGGGPIAMGVAALVVLVLTALASERALVLADAVAAVTTVVATLNSPPRPAIVAGLATAAALTVAAALLLFVVRLRRLRVLMALTVPSASDAFPADQSPRA